MKTIKVSISDLEFKKFGLQSTDYTFSEWLDIISKELAKQRLEQSLELAEKSGISKMTIDEITDEVKSARSEAKNNS